MTRDLGYDDGYETGVANGYRVAMDEIRPLVDDLHSLSVLRRADLKTIIQHRRAVDRLCELVRKAGE